MISPPVVAWSPSPSTCASLWVPTKSLLGTAIIWSLNRNAEIITSVGSRVPGPNREMVSVYKLCCELNIWLSVGLVSVNDSSTAHELSRVEDATDYMLDPKCFCYIDWLWGPYTANRFASIKTKQLDRFCSQ